MTQEAHSEECPSPCPSDGWACLRSCDVQEFSLARPCDVRGLLHCHTAHDTGEHDLANLVDTARALGLEYLGVTDRASTPLEECGLDAMARSFQKAEIDRFNAGCDDIAVLRGLEIEVDERGDLPLADEELSAFDYVVATLRNGEGLTRAEHTARALRTVMNPYVNILGHPFGEWMTTEWTLPLDLEAVLAAAAEADVAIEIDANPTHSNLGWRNCERAQELGVPLVIASDVHRAARLADYRHGVELTRRAGLCCQQILNTRSLEEVRRFFAV